MDPVIHMALIDPYQLSRECMTAAFSQGGSPLSVTPFDSAERAIASSTPSEFDLLVINVHGRTAQLSSDVAALRNAAFDQPIVMVSASSAPAEMAALADALRQGASGHLPLQSTTVDMAISSFVFAREGGTFAPMALLLTEPPQPRPSARRARPRRAAARLPRTVTETSLDDEHA
ncbi:response regulator [Acidisoma sp. 7E03]